MDEGGTSIRIFVQIVEGEIISHRRAHDCKGTMWNHGSPCPGN